MISKVLSKVCRRPNKFEERVGKFLEEKFPNIFRYVGNGSFRVNGKSADYVNKSETIVVLCNGLYWHLLRKGLSDCIEDKRRVEFMESEPFTRAGYEVWFIWDESPFNIISYKEKDIVVTIT